jgi:hypothetical protein
VALTKTCFDIVEHRKATSKNDLKGNRRTNEIILTEKTPSSWLRAMAGASNIFWILFFSTQEKTNGMARGEKKYDSSAVLRGVEAI